MISMDINHPDVLDFITIKQDLTKVTGANISIKTNAEFMKAVENNEDYLLRFPCNKQFSTEYIHTFKYNELTPINNADNTITYVKRIKAKEIWNTLIECAHKTAEPGIMFEDNHHDYSPDSVYPQFKGVTTNP